MATPGRFTVRKCLIDDIPGVDDFFRRVVYADEPLLTANNLSAPSVGEGLSAAIIPQGFSILAEDDVGNIIGASLNDEPPQTFPIIYSSTPDDLKDMFLYMEEASKVTQLAPEAIEIRLIAVDPSWRRNGVASSLIDASVSVAKNRYNFVKIYCTSSFTDKMVRKLGWDQLFALSYRKYVQDFQVEMETPPEPHSMCTLYTLRV